MVYQHGIKIIMKIKNFKKSYYLFSPDEFCTLETKKFKYKSDLSKFLAKNYYHSLGCTVSKV